jgi:raffinose/stachyose/melibiose transport system substrate-binding protein
MKHAKKLLLIFAVLALLASACGDDDDSSDASSGDDPVADGDSDTGSGLEGTLRVLIHQNPAGVEFFENFNDEFEAANPGVSIDLSVVNADDIPTINQTRLTASDIDVTTISVTGFANPVQPYMTDADSPYWQQLVEAGLLMDLSGESFLENYDDAAVASGSFGGSTYAVSLGRTTYSGVFVNLDILAEVGVEVPTTFDELEAACTAVNDAGFKCMVAGGADSWPVFVGTYGLLGALYPDQEALAEGLWTGAAKWNDEQGLELFDKYARFADMLDAESAGLGGDAAASRYTVGDIAFGPMGAWNAGTIDDAEFEWTYIPFPGSDDAADNMSLAVAADTPVEDLSIAYLEAFSEPDNYDVFANATNYLPTQPTAALTNTLGQSVAPILQAGSFTIGFEQVFVAPTGAGQWANGKDGSLWMFNGDFSDPVDAANTAQSDLESGL